MTKTGFVNTRVIKSSSWR